MHLLAGWQLAFRNYAVHGRIRQGSLELDTVKSSLVPGPDAIAVAEFDLRDEDFNFVKPHSLPVEPSDHLIVLGARPRQAYKDQPAADFLEFVDAGTDRFRSDQHVDLSSQELTVPTFFLAREDTGSQTQGRDGIHQWVDNPRDEGGVNQCSRLGELSNRRQFRPEEGYPLCDTDVSTESRLDRCLPNSISGN